MRIGELNKRITIQKSTTETNENGFDAETWVKWKTVWAKVENLSIREYWAAKAIQAENTIKFTIRYLPGVLPTMRILFQDKQYNIEPPQDVGFKHAYMEIKATEVKSSG